MFKRSFSRTHPYLLKNNSFPQGATESTGRGSIVWMAPSAKEFKKNAKMSPGSNFQFHDDVSTKHLKADSKTVVVSAQKIGKDFMQEWKSIAAATAGTTDNNSNKKEGLLTLVRRGTSLGSIDLVAASEFGIKVINTPGVNSPHVAKFAIEKLKLDDEAVAGATSTPAEIKAVVIGAGSVGKFAIDMMNSVGVVPTVVTRSTMQLAALEGVSPEEKEKKMKALQERYGLNSKKATLTGSLDSAIGGCTHLLVCCATDGLDALVTEAHVQKMLSSPSSPKSLPRVCCISRPEAFSIEAITALAKSGAECTFDYGPTVIGPVKEKVLKNLGDSTAAASKISWTSAAMGSEACKEDLDEAVLRYLNPKIPQFITTSNDSWIEGDAVLRDLPQDHNSPSPKDEVGGGGEGITLGVAGGPAAWIHAFLHLNKPVAALDSGKNKVLLYRPSGDHALWESSGRHISLREKVTKFVNPRSALKNVVYPALSDTEKWFKFARLGFTFAAERMIEQAHEDCCEDVLASLESYVKINEFLKDKCGGEKPIWRETGRLVIAKGPREYHDLYKTVFQYRKSRKMVDEENLSATEDYMKRYSNLLFNEGYAAYPLARGGYVTKDAEARFFKAMKNYYGEERFTVVDSKIKHVTCNSGYDFDGDHGTSFTISSSDTKEVEVDKLFLSTGTTHILRGGSAETGGDFERLFAPIEITGHSCIVEQTFSEKIYKKILEQAGGNVKNLEEFFETNTAAFMTDDYECTLNSVDIDPATGRECIHWRLTGNAMINSSTCPLDPVKTLFEPVQRFLCAGATQEDRDQGCSVKLISAKDCPRQVGPTVREQVLDFPSLTERYPAASSYTRSSKAPGVIALNWGHMGVTLGGRPLLKL